MHADYLGSEIDNNDDGFMDLPKSRQFNILNRYKYQGDKVVSQLGLHFLRDEKAGGQLGFDFVDNLAPASFYGFFNRTTTAEVFGKTGLLFPSKPYKGWGFIYSARYNQIEAGYGDRLYDGEETTLYANLINQNIIGNSFHQYKTGMSILYDDFDETFADSTFQRTEIVPGAYFEYNYIPSDKFTVVIGNRLDFHNLYGTYYTPRLHAKYTFAPGWTARVSAGRGYRTPNPLAENSQILVSSRRVRVLDSPEPEVSWNFGGTLVGDYKVGERPATLIFDYFYTTFENQLIYDMDQNSSELNIYNLRGESFAHSMQLEGSLQFTERLGAKAAYKLYDVRATIDDELRKVPMIPTHRIFVNASYALPYDKWTADATLQWFGQRRLPDTQDKPAEFQRREFAPDYFLLNAQVSRGFRWGNIYVGSENLLNFTQNDPIIDPGNPFSDQFDASMVWAPVAGRMIYAGIRYKIER
jgi:outer membrane receptor protein involved in Fe transport